MPTFTKVTCGSDSPLLAEVVKTTSDPYVGRLSLVRVFSGTIRPDTTVHVSGHFSSFFGSLKRGRPDSCRAMPTTTRTNASVRCRSRWASSSGPRRWCCPATCARSDD